MTSKVCHPGRNIYDNAEPDSWGSAFLFSTNGLIRNANAAPYFMQSDSVQLVRLGANTIDKLAVQPNNGLNGHSTYFTWSRDGQSVAVFGGGHFALARVGANASMDIPADCTCSSVAFSYDSTLAAWDEPANQGQTVAEAAVVQPVAGGATTKLGGLPGGSIQGLAFTRGDPSTLKVASWDVAAVADDGENGGTLARAITAAVPAGGRLFYLRADQPGLWMANIPQPLH